MLRHFTDCSTHLQFADHAEAGISSGIPTLPLLARQVRAFFRQGIDMLLIILIGITLSFALPESAQPEWRTRTAGRPMRRHWLGRCTTGEPNAIRCIASRQKQHANQKARRRRCRAFTFHRLYAHALAPTDCHLIRLCRWVSIQDQGSRMHANAR